MKYRSVGTYQCGTTFYLYLYLHLYLYVRWDAAVVTISFIRKEEAFLTVFYLLIQNQRLFSPSTRSHFELCHLSLWQRLILLSARTQWTGNLMVSESGRNS